MEETEVLALVGVVNAVERGCADRRRLEAAMAAAAKLQAWLDGRTIRLTTDLAAVSRAAEQEIAAASRSSLRGAQRLLERAQVVGELAPLAEALEAGSLSGAHVDVVSAALRKLEPEERPALARSAAWLVEVATRSTPEELRKVLGREVRELQGARGLAVLEQQRQACRLRTWIDDASGMFHLAAELDPERGLRLHGRLMAAVDRLFAEQVPVGAPSDPRERQSFLRAHALLALTKGRAGGCSRAEVTVVLDTTPADGPVVDWGLPVELPVEVLHELFGVADVATVVVRNGAILHAPGRLDLGRTSRLANRDQRRALRAIYPTCAIPGCDTRYDLCKLHHVVWWEQGGSTDLDNLLPLCVRHHHAVHDGGWQVELQPDRQLTITVPGGTPRTTGPPARAAPTERR